MKPAKEGIHLPDLKLEAAERRLIHEALKRTGSLVEAATLQLAVGEPQGDRPGAGRRGRALGPALHPRDQQQHHPAQPRVPAVARVARSPQRLLAPADAQAAERPSDGAAEPPR